MPYLKLFILTFLAFSVNAYASVEIGKKAPDFTLTDHTGKEHTLSSYKGKTVVLEWTNYHCPFVRKHYDSKNMQRLQHKYSNQDDIVWLSVISSAPGKQGYLSKENAAEKVAAQGVKVPVLRDTDGKVGRLYKAQTTPHMYVINKEGDLAYMGAIDSIPSFKPSDISRATNYVEVALNKLKAGEKVNPGTTKSYGCSVKY